MFLPSKNNKKKRGKVFKWAIYGRIPLISIEEIILKHFVFSFYRRFNFCPIECVLLYEASTRS